MANAHPDDMERLASRLAMIVSDDGEAGNAGVAAAHLARRMGLTGGQLKAIVLSGAVHEGATGPHVAAVRSAAEQAIRADRLERETAGLRHSLRQLDVEVRRSQEEAEVLRETGSALREQLDRARARLRIERRMAVSVVLLVLVGLLGWATIPGLRLGEPAVLSDRSPSDPAAIALAEPPAGSAVAIARVPGAEVHSAPDRASATIARLAVGEKVGLHQLVWHDLSQWAEVEAAGQIGYVSTNDVELP